MATGSKGDVASFQECFRKKVRIMKIRTFVSAALVGVISLGGLTLGADDVTLTGAVGDADCGVTHQMPGTSATCTLACIANGSKFAILAENTAYAFETENEDLKAELEQLAGILATITGDVTGERIVVASVTMVE